MSTYHLCDTKAQWFQDNYPGADLNLSADTMVLALHTTEGSTWPGYNGGATAPNTTIKPNIKAKRLEFRAHFPDEKSSRALVNSAGGVETNTLNAMQVELVGTCDPAHAKRWGSLRAGIDYIYWPEAPEWALRDLATFVADLHKRHGLKLQAPKFKAYPGSYGTSNGVRMSFSQWRNFCGICGHQHVPENVHGDPGNFPIDTLLKYVDEILKPTAPTPERAEVPTTPTRVTEARGLISKGLALLDEAVKAGRTGAVKTGRDQIRSGLNTLPRR